MRLKQEYHSCIPKEKILYHGLLTIIELNARQQNRVLIMPVFAKTCALLCDICRVYAMFPYWNASQNKVLKKGCCIVLCWDVLHNDVPNKYIT